MRGLEMRPAPVSTPQGLVQLSFEVESLLSTAGAFGMDTSALQGRLREAMAWKDSDTAKATSMLTELRTTASFWIDTYVPDISLEMALTTPLVRGRWADAELGVCNTGPARALRTRVVISGDFKLRGLEVINLLKGGGSTKKLPLRMKPSRSGELMARIDVSCQREYDDKSFVFHDVRWLLAREEGVGVPDGPSPHLQFARREVACTICQGTVGTQEAPRACSCGATFHQACAEQPKRCPKCGKPLGGG